MTKGNLDGNRGSKKQEPKSIRLLMVMCSNQAMLLWPPARQTKRNHLPLRRRFLRVVDAPAASVEGAELEVDVVVVLSSSAKSVSVSVSLLSCDSVSVCEVDEES
jgi:hypothetical protein